MYVSYLLVLLGIAALAASPAMLALALGFQAAGRRLVLAEERWCLARFGEPYAEYMGRVRRYCRAAPTPVRRALDALGGVGGGKRA